MHKNILFILFCLYATVYTAKTFKMAALYGHSFNDFGWNFSHEEARAAAEIHLVRMGYEVTSEVYTNIGPSGALPIMQDLAARGFDLIYTTSFDYLSANTEIANAYPNVKILSMASFGLTDNQMGMSGRAYQGRWLAGYACGHITKTKVVGYIASIPVAGILQQANAFALGVWAVDPTIEVRVSILHTWIHPVLARKAAILMTESGMDCGTAHLDDYTVQQVWSERGIPTFGFAGDTRYQAGENVLFSLKFEWTPYVIDAVDAIINGTFDQTWGKKYRWGGIKEGAIVITPYSTELEPDLKNIIEDQKQGFFNDSKTAQFPFCGQIATEMAATTYLQGKGNLTAAGCLNDFMLNSYPVLLDDINNFHNYTYDEILEKFYVSTKDGLGIAIFVIASIFIAICLFLAVDVWIFRNTDVFRSSSPVFLILIILGGAIAFASTYFWAAEPTRENCMARVWLAGIAFSLIYSCLLAKNWRIWRIFKNSTMEVFSISNFDLLVKGVLPVLVAEVIILACWNGIDPLVPQQQSSVLLGLDEPRVFVFCSSQQQWGIAVFLTFKALLLVFGTVISYNTKSIAKRFHESEAIGFSIYNTLLVGFVAIAIEIAVQRTAALESAVISFAIFIIIGGVLAFIFVDKVWQVNVLGKKDDYELQSVKVGTDSGSKKGRSTATATTASSLGKATNSSKKSSGLSDTNASEVDDAAAAAASKKKGGNDKKKNNKKESSDSDDSDSDDEDDKKKKPAAQPKKSASKSDVSEKKGGDDKKKSDGKKEESAPKKSASKSDVKDDKKETPKKDTPKKKKEESSDSDSDESSEEAPKQPKKSASKGDVKKGESAPKKSASKSDVKEDKKETPKKEAPKKKKEESSDSESDESS